MKKEKKRFKMKQKIDWFEVGGMFMFINTMIAIVPILQGFTLYRIPLLLGWSFGLIYQSSILNEHLQGLNQKNV